MEIGKDHYLVVCCHLDFINVCITSPSRKGLLHVAGADWFLSEVVTLLVVKWFLPAVVRHTLIGGQPVHLPLSASYSYKDVPSHGNNQLLSTGHQCTMGLSPLKTCIKEIEQNAFLCSHFLEISLFQTKYLEIVLCPVSLLIYIW